MEYYENRLKTFDTYPKQMLPDKISTGLPLSRISNVTTGKGYCIVGVHWFIQKIDNPIIPSIT